MGNARAFEHRHRVASQQGARLAGPSGLAERRPLASHASDGAAARPGFERDFSKVPVGGSSAKTAATGTTKPSSRGGFLQSLGSFFADFFSGPGTAITRLFGSSSYTNEELTRYLAGLALRRDIEGDYDSDNKARAVVSRWRAAQAGFNLTGLQKMLLIRELQSGATLDDDERAILHVLKRSELGDLRLIFTHIRVDDLLGDFDGAEAKELRTWLELRFENGLEGLRKGTPQPEGRFPAGAPLFPYDSATLLTKFESDQYGPSEIIDELARHPLDERERASRDLAVARTTLHRKVQKLRDDRLKASDRGAAARIDAEIAKLILRQQRMDIVMEEGFKDVVLAERPTDFASKVKALTPDEKRAAREALRPEVRSAGGVPAAFVARLPGESRSYTEKLRALAPGMIQGYWDRTAKTRQPADHADASKMHTLQEMEDLAAVSKDETDQVFDGYYDKSRHPPMKADRPGRRGSLHDLWADTEQWMSSPRTTFAEKQATARALMFYFFQTNARDVAPLNRQHNASPRFDSRSAPTNDEAVAQTTIAREFTTTAAQVRKLNEIDRGWDASANPTTREVNIQLFKPEGGVSADQDFMWDMFQTLIHEYLHTLVHPAYVRHARTFGAGSPEENTLLEGVDSFLDEIVWANVQPRVNDRALRERVEGTAYARLPPIQVRHALRRRYPSFTETVRLVNIVGFRNVVLAYFKGDVAHIGA